MIEVAVSDPIEITRVMNVAGYKVYKEFRGLNMIIETRQTFFRFKLRAERETLYLRDIFSCNQDKFWGVKIF